MKYKDVIKECIEEFSKNSSVIFIGYNVAKGNKGNGSLQNVPEEKLFETPVAENLIMSMAIGLSIEGYIPVVYYECFNFILNALDAMVNHLDKFEQLSKGEYIPKVIIRTVVGGMSKPFYTGITHTQDFTEAIKNMVNFDVIKLPTDYTSIKNIYKNALNSNKSTLIIEEKDLYEYDV